MKNMRIISGIQPTGKLHIGNYIGAIKQWLELEKENECIFFIADLHSLTVPYETFTLQKRIKEVLADYLACGLNNKKNIFFVQSHVKEHTELSWLLNCITPIGELKRMTQFKEKSEKLKENVNAGLLSYPVLMAADILLYQTDLVPVGKDQIQHLELCRTIARKFNSRFGETFKEPQPLVLKTGQKIMSLNDPLKKMSKSSPEGCLFLGDEPKIIIKKIMSAVTDLKKEIKYNPKLKPGISNLLTIYSVFTDISISNLEKQYQGKGYAEFKKDLASVLVERLKIFQEKRNEFLKKEEFLNDILAQGAKKAQKIAAKTMLEVRKKMGLI